MSAHPLSVPTSIATVFTSAGKHTFEPSQKVDVERVSVSAGDVLPLLLHAARADRAWLQDFLDEPLEITQELYEVLLAYKRMVSEAEF